jgi:putative endonuclease
MFGEYGFRAVVAQLVERVLGKDEVTSSILVNGSTSWKEPAVERPWRKVTSSILVNGSRSLKHYVYLLRSISTGRHYIGSTADIARRLDEHNTRNGRWTSAYKPWALVTAEAFETRSEARRRETYLKSRAGIAERLRLFGRSQEEIL